MQNVGLGECKRDDLGWGQQTFSGKGQIVDILGFAPLQLCPWSMKAATGNMEVGGQGCFLIKLYLQDQAMGGIWPWVDCVQTPDMD